MTRIATLGITATVALAGLATTAHAGLDTGWGTDCWYTGADLDNDGLNDACEADLASDGSPGLWFDSGESAKGRLPHFAVRNWGYSTKCVQVMYMFSYYQDDGDFAGISHHDGDPEFIVNHMCWSGSGTTWNTDYVYMSGHRGHWCDESSWYYYTSVEWGAHRGWPIVHVAEDKHANYATDDDCDGGCAWLDNCSNNDWQWVHDDYNWSMPDSRNVGSLGNQRVNYVSHRGDAEWLLSNTKFCGWERAGNSSTSGCSNNYYTHLQDFESDNL